MLLFFVSLEWPSHWRHPHLLCDWISSLHRLWNVCSFNKIQRAFVATFQWNFLFRFKPFVSKSVEFQSFDIWVECLPFFGSVIECVRMGALSKWAAWFPTNECLRVQIALTTLFSNFRLFLEVIFAILESSLLLHFYFVWLIVLYYPTCFD